MGTYGTATGIVLWFNPDTGYGELMNLVDGETVLLLSGPNMTLQGTLAVGSPGSITWAGGKGRADDTGIEHVEDVNNLWRVEPSGAYLMTIEAATAFSSGALNVSNSGGVGIFVSSDASAFALSAEGNPFGAIFGGSDGGTAIHGAGAIGVKAEMGLGGTAALAIVGGIVDGGSQRYTAMGTATAGTDGMNRDASDARYATLASGRRWHKWFEA